MGSSHADLRGRIEGEARRHVASGSPEELDERAWKTRKTLSRTRLLLKIAYVQLVAVLAPWAQSFLLPSDRPQATSSAACQSGVTFGLVAVFLARHMLLDVALQKGVVIDQLLRLPSFFIPCVLHALPCLLATSITWRHCPTPSEVDMVQQTVLSVESAVSFLTAASLASNSRAAFFIVCAPACVLQLFFFLGASHGDMIPIVILSSMSVITTAWMRSSLETRVQRAFSNFSAAHCLGAKATVLEASMRSNVEQLFDASCICSASGELLQTSQALLAILGVEEPVSLTDFVHQPARLAAFLSHAKNYAQSRCSQLPTTVQPAGSPHSLEITLFAFSLQGAAGLFVGLRLAGSLRGHSIDYDFSVVAGPAAITLDDSRQSELATKFRKRQALWLGSELSVLASLWSMMLCLLRFVLISELPDLPLVLSIVLAAVLRLSSQGSARGHTSSSWQDGNLGFGLQRVLRRFAHIGMTRVRLVALLKLAFVWTLSQAIAKLALLTHGQAMQSFLFLNLHALVHFTLPMIFDTSPYMNAARAAMQLCWCANFIGGFSGFVQALAVAISSSLIFRVMPVMRRAVQIDLKKQEAARNLLEIRRNAYTKMLESLFDASCVCSSLDHLVGSASCHFSAYFKDMVGYPLFIIGRHQKERMSILANLQSALYLPEREARVFTAEVMMVGFAPSMKACCTFLVARHVSSKDGQENEIFVGMQFSDFEDLEAREQEPISIHVSDVKLATKHEEPTVSPGDSISQCSTASEGPRFRQQRCVGTMSRSKSSYL